MTCVGSPALPIRLYSPHVSTRRTVCYVPLGLYADMPRGTFVPCHDLTYVAYLARHVVMTLCEATFHSIPRRKRHQRRRGLVDTILVSLTPDAFCLVIMLGEFGFPRKRGRLPASLQLSCLPD